MKDVSISIWSRLSSKHYSSVSKSAKPDELRQQWDANLREQPDSVLYGRSLRRKSSVVVNQFFNNALPLDSSGRPKWSKSELFTMSKIFEFLRFLFSFVTLKIFLTIIYYVDYHFNRYMQRKIIFPCTSQKN